MEVVYTSVGSGLAVTGQFSTVSGGTYINSSSFSSGPGSANSGVLGASTGLIYSSAVRGNYFQIAVSALTSGTVTGTLTLRATSPFPTAFYNTYGSTTTSGTITTSSSSITSGNVQGYNGLIPITVHGTYSGVSFGITVSEDNAVTFYNVPIYDAGSNVWRAAGATLTPGTNASALYYVSSPPNSSGSVIKVLASAYTSGTATIRIGSGGAPNQLPTSGSQIIDGAGNNRSANVDSANRLIVNDGLMPLNTTLNTYEAQITTTTTTTPTAATAYISSITLLVATGVATGTLTIQDKQGTPIKVVSLFSTAVTATTPVIYNFQTPIKMTSGIDIITATAAATVNVWINYYQ
jgi:hypothetical protein